MKKCRILFFSALFVFSGLAGADVRLPAIFSEHMVLLRADKVPIWGEADPGEKISVTLNGQTVETTAGNDGKWLVHLNLAESPEGPFEMLVRGKNAVNIGDVVVGEVWLGSGQSNMEQSMYSQVPSEEETATAVNPMLRQFIVIKNLALEPQEEADGFWLSVKPGQTDTMSAVGYYFGKDIQSEINRPVGIIKAPWGGRAIESFISSPSFDSVQELKEVREETWGEVKTLASAFNDWLKSTDRMDRSTLDMNAFLDTEASEANGWVKVKDSGLVDDPALPKYGAIWFRKDIKLTAEQARAPQYMYVGLKVADFFQIYFNGKLLEQEDLDDYTNASRQNSRTYIMPDNMHEGVNQLALRVFSPSRQIHLAWAPMFNGKPTGGGWLAKAEFALPDLPKDEKPPQLPPGMHTLPCALYNGMINPLVPYAIRGVIWYQGESNSNDPKSYQKLMPLLIHDWRKLWNNEHLPFYYCQLANWNKKLNVPVESDWAELREAQLMSLSVPDTGMTVLIDTGEWKDIHPQTKHIAGERLARVALAKTYVKSIVYSGPIYDSMKVEGDTIRISFKYVDGGLVFGEVPDTYPELRVRGTTAPLIRNSPNSELEGFAICGSDQKWVWADARIDGDTVLVWSDKVNEPVAVRYGWARNPTCNLYNQAGLPASPFRTDDFKVFTERK